MPQRGPERSIRAVGVSVGLPPFFAPMVAVFAGPTVAPHAIAQGECTGSDTPDDYTLQCAPAAVPDFNDQLSEAEVAEPGFNGGPPGGGGGGGMAGRRSRWRRWTSLSNYPMYPVSHPMKA